MVMAIYGAENGSDRKSWLAEAYSHLQKDYMIWTRPPHLAGSTGLSRYYDFGQGPAPESLEGEPGYYRKVTTYFLRHPTEASGYGLQDQREVPRVAPGTP